MRTVFRFLLAIPLLLLVEIVSAQSPDPGTPGPYPTKVDYYNLGDLVFKPDSFPYQVEVRGVVHYPNEFFTGPFPVLMFMHGRHSVCYDTTDLSTAMAWPCTGVNKPIISFDGYNYLAEHLASHGFVVISISANAINASDASLSNRGMYARAELMQYHLDLWNSWNMTNTGPFGDRFVGKLDLDSVGTMGHSRGGEGVMRHAILNDSLGSPYGLRAVLPLAPTDYTYPVVNHIPVMNIAPYCDGDVTTLSGIHYYDKARYNVPGDEAPKYNLVMLGANHNFYNTVWTPGLYPAGTADDWDYWRGSDPFCYSTASASGRLTEEEQRKALLTYSSAFFLYHVANREEYGYILQVKDVIPPPSIGLPETDFYMSWLPPASKRLDINTNMTEAHEMNNDLGDTVIVSGLVQFDVCADDLGEIDCSSTAYRRQEPHSGNSGVLGMPQLQIEWDDSTDYFENHIPITYSNWLLYDAIQFRAANNFPETSPSDSIDFSIVLYDIHGDSAVVVVSDFSTALYYPLGTKFAILPKILHNTIRIPLSDFNHIDRTRITRVRFLFDQIEEGSIMMSELSLVYGDPVVIVGEEEVVPQHSMVKVYPNPAKDLLKVELTDWQGYPYYSITDVSGRVLMTGELNSENSGINIEELGSGLYLINLHGKGRKASAKFLVID